MMTVDHYPVSLNVADLLTVFLSIVLTALLIAYIGSRLAAKRPSKQRD
jgi:ABC-type antimicrobial peptide transport system permease subunit